MFIIKVMYMELVQDLLLPVVLSTLSAYGAAVFAFRKYKNEKRWDDKREKYFLVIESVEYIAAWYESKRNQMGAEQGLIRFGNDTSQLEVSERVIQKYAAIGNLYFSKDFVSVLSQLYLNLEQKVYSRGEEYECANDDPEREFWIENRYYASVSHTSSEALKKLLKLSERDLVKK
ncbi:hypothetical protein D5E86_25660 [Vibrio parahaemolyticus]|nr:hypothetical protein [Vibrio parahaemolyticus]KHF15899.1 hypothetical protein PO80_09230 [Vibrio parahaemolyticus]MBE3888695.1 hypothetical protein [Vibrio parahaemolyticus]OTV99124.1 hypothetical protein BA740_24300 [Vibrio parahaemolyticus]TBT23557.1 hypothetical protein D5E86_25660 [Vibrio parahaemolyticus]